MVEENNDLEVEIVEPGIKAPSWGWPHVAAFLIAAVVILLFVWWNAPFGRGVKMADRPVVSTLPQGKTYTAVGAVLTCNVFTTGQFGAGTYRAMIRTPKDEFFDVFFRQGHEPPNSGPAIGTLKYHECGTLGDQVVHCFDSFAMSGEGLPLLDQDGKRMTPKEAAARGFEFGSATPVSPKAAPATSRVYGIQP